MNVFGEIFGFYVQEKFRSLTRATTYCFLAAGLSFAAGLLWPPLGVLFYPALIFLAWQRSGGADK